MLVVLTLLTTVMINLTSSSINLNNNAEKLKPIDNISVLFNDHIKGIKQCKTTIDDLKTVILDTVSCNHEEININTIKHGKCEYLIVMRTANKMFTNLDMIIANTCFKLVTEILDLNIDPLNIHTELLNRMISEKKDPLGCEELLTYISKITNEVNHIYGSSSISAMIKYVTPVYNQDRACCVAKYMDKHNYVSEVLYGSQISDNIVNIIQKYIPNKCDIHTWLVKHLRSIIITNLIKKVSKQLS